MKICGERGSGRPHSMTHGDFHKDNMFMNCEFGVLDFQLCRAQELFIAEISWFLTSCVSNISREEEREMLEGYYLKLVSLEPEVKQLWPSYDDMYFYYQLSWFQPGIYVQFITEQKVPRHKGVML